MNEKRKKIAFACIGMAIHKDAITWPIQANESHSWWDCRSHSESRTIFFLFLHCMALLLLISLPFLSSAQPLVRYEYTKPKMGTEFRLVLYATSQAQANQAAEAAFQKIDALNKIFSDYDADSELSRLSISAGSGQKIPVSKELWEVLSLAQHIAKKSKGAFDVTIGPLSKLWRRAIRQNVFPDRAVLAAAKKNVSYKNLRLDKEHHSVSLKKAGMRIDLGGIAKGYTVDEIYKVLCSQGIPIALVDGGGDIYAGGRPPEAAGWKVAILSRQTRVPSLDFFDSTSKTWSKQQDLVLYLENKAIASSGNTYQYLELDGVKYSHIVNPKTGLGLVHNDILNVQAPTCVLADALASTLSVLSPKKGQRLLKKFKDCEVKDGK